MSAGAARALLEPPSPGEPAYDLLNKVRRPDFFLVGAPRCASTFMYTFLRRHPQIYLPEVKEPRFMCRDLDSGDAADARMFIRGWERYLSLFLPVTDELRVGEACVFNLYSKVAAENIRRFNPTARIIIQLREPVEQMYSFHAVRVRNLTEDLGFEAALAAEADRRLGRRLPARARNYQMYQYRDMARYTDQVARYFDAFGRENVEVVIYEDLIRDPAQAYRRTLEFLGVDPDYLPDLSVVNPNRSYRVRELAAVVGAPDLV
jgi:hypothetical protein